MKKTLLIITVITATIQLFSQQIAVKAVLDTNIIEFGNQTILRIQLQTQNADNVYFPQFKDTIGDGVEYVDEFQVDTINSNPFTIEKAYTITAFKDSIRTIPSLPIFISTDTVWTPQVQILVTPLNIDSAFVAKVDTTQMIPIFDIKPPFDAPLTFKEFWIRFGRWIVLSIVVLALLAIGFWIAYRMYKNKPIKILEKPKEPAHVIAFKALEELKRKKIFQQEKSKEYYSELTNILRTYIEHRFRVPALENTSTEILTSFDKVKLIDNEQFETLRTILTTADLCKFAKFNQLQNVNEANFKLAHDFVHKTKIIEETVNSE